MAWFKIAKRVHDRLTIPSISDRASGIGVRGKTFKWRIPKLEHSRFINSVSKYLTFSCAIEKSEVSTKNPDIPWSGEDYTLSAVSRGKELKVTVNGANKTFDIIFRFGMSGKFSYDNVKELHKHAHLRFYTKDRTHALCFVDYRRFGKWEITAEWGKGRGPCIIQEYSLFRFVYLIFC